MRGDAYPIGFEVFAADGKTRITPELVSEVEIVICGIRKTYSGSEIYYANDLWNFPITQQETFAMPELGKCQIRVKNGNEVIGEYVEAVYVTESQSKEVL